MGKGKKPTPPQPDDPAAKDSSTAPQQSDSTSQDQGTNRSEPPKPKGDEPSGSVEVSALTLEEKLDILAEKVRRRRQARQEPNILTQIDLPAVDASTIKEVKRQKRTRKLALPETEAPTVKEPPVVEEPREASLQATPVEPPAPKPKKKVIIAKPKTQEPGLGDPTPSQRMEESLSANNPQFAELQMTIAALNEEVRSLKKKLEKAEKPAEGEKKERPGKKGRVESGTDDAIAMVLPVEERRRYIRHKSESVTLMVFKAGLLDKLRMSKNIGHALVDISAGGFSAVITREIEPFTPVRAQLQLPRLKQTLELSGEVRWCSKLSSDYFEVGVVFLELSANDTAALRTWIQYLGNETE
jgi:hypothetical protein